MAYDELLGALADEVRRQASELREAAARQAAELTTASEQAATTLRDDGLTQARARVAAEVARGRDEARRIEARAELLEQRRLLEALVTEVRAELLIRADEALTRRLLDELLPEVEGAALELVVDDAAVAALVRGELARRDAALAARAVVRVRAVAVGGLEAVLDGLVLLDDTLPSRLERLWPEVEPRAAAALFAEDGDGAL